MGNDGCNIFEIKPKVSVIIPLYNYESYIEECLLSVLSQRFDYIIEIVISDDCSTDNSLNIIKRIKSFYENDRFKFRIIEQDINLGEIKNTDFLVKEATGEYIAYLDADDYWCDPYKLKKQIEFLDSNDEYSLCITGYYRLGEEGFQDLKFNSWDCPLDFDITTDKLITMNYVGASSSRVFRNYGSLYRDYMDDFFSSDWCFNFELSLRGKIKYIDIPTYVYRLHDMSMTSLDTKLTPDYNSNMSEILKKRKEEYYKKERLVFITPHLSTGGLPQYLLKKIEYIKDSFDIYVIEYKYLSSEYTIQRDKIEHIVNLLSIERNSLNLIGVLKDLNPDYIWMEEIGETFLSDEELSFIYDKNRKYLILETTHTSNDYSRFKRYLPDKFIMPCEYTNRQYEHFDTDIEILEYPVVELERYSKLKFDKSYKHVVIVGLFTSGKNQKYAFDIAEKLQHEKIIFHFIGNTALNFKDYWEPLINDKPENCVIHGEQENVIDFLMEADLFLFPSILELNPIVIKEALSIPDLPLLIFNLDTYMNKYDNNDNVNYLTNDIDTDVSLVRSILGLGDRNGDYKIIKEDEF